MKKICEKVFGILTLNLITINLLFSQITATDAIIPAKTQGLTKVSSSINLITTYSNSSSKETLYSSSYGEYEERKFRMFFEHPDYKNEDIKELYLTIVYRKLSSYPAGSSITKIKMPNHACNNSIPWDSNLDEDALFSLNSCITNGDVIFNEGIGSPDALNWTTENIQIYHEGDEITGNNLQYFDLQTNDFTIAFDCYVDGTEIQSVTAHVTYECSIPETPQNVTASPYSQSEIQLSWPSVDGASSYEVYNCTGSTVIKTSMTNSCIIGGLNPNTSYSYRIKAVSHCGESDFSNCATSKTNLSIPTSFTSTKLANNSVQLSWSPVAGASRYKVYSCSGVYLISTTETTYTTSVLPVGYEYSYKIMAESDDNNSKFTTCRDEYFPKGVENFIATPISSSEIKLTWDDDPQVIMYYIYDCSEFTTFNQTSTGEVTIGGFSPDSDEEFLVKAYYGGSDYSYSPCVSTTTLVDVPTDIVASAIDETTISLSWSAVSWWHEFEIYEKTLGLIETTESKTITVSGLTNGQTYEFRIRAKIQNYSEFSPYVAITPKLSTPMPTFSKISSTQYKLSWNSIDGASGYDIFLTPNVRLASTAATSYTFTLASGEGIGISVRAINPYDRINGCSNHSGSTYAFHAPSCVTSLSLSNQTLLNKMYKAQGDITCQNSTVEPCFGAVFESEASITLNTGFVAKKGSYFKAEIESCGVSNLKSAKLEFDEELSTEITNEEIEKVLKIYPNPVDTYLQVFSSQTINVVKVFSSNGTYIKSVNANESSNVEIDFSSLASGIYFIQIDNGQLLKVIKE